MRWFHQWAMRIRMLFRRGGQVARLDDELRFHLDRLIAENLAAGMSAEEARTAALRAFGNPALVRDQARATWGLAGLEVVWRELGYGARTLWRSPGFSLTAAAVMALCIGAATSLYTIVRSVLAKPLPFRDPDSLVMISEHFRASALNGEMSLYNTTSTGDFYDWRSQTHGFADMAAWRFRQFNLSGERGELPEAVRAAAATWNFFGLLGVQPVYGRPFTEDEDRPEGNAVLLTWSLFLRRFGGNPAIVGREIHLDSRQFVVVGVLPSEFTYPDATVQLWVPYASGATEQYLHYHAWHQSRVIARLHPDVSLADAMSQVEAVQYRLHLEYPTAAVAEDVLPRTLADAMSQNVRKPLLLLLCAVGCMLFIGCLNVANLLVARGAARQREVAIRSALGARRLTLVREQLTESLLICAAGGTAGVLLSLIATRWLVHAWRQLPRAEAVHVDAGVLCIACALIFAAALLAGLLPAVVSTGKAALEGMQTSARTAGAHVGRTALRKTLLTVEIAVTVVLLIVSGLLLKSFARMRRGDIGIAADHLLTLGYALPAQKYRTAEQEWNFSQALLDRLRALPGVRSVALASALPGAGWVEDDIFSIVEHPPIRPGDALPDAMDRSADPGYFAALGIPLVRGRFFTSGDRGERGNKAIVNEQLARQYFPGEDPIGKHVHIAHPAGSAGIYEIVGVVGDTLWQAGQPVKATLYFPLFCGVHGSDLTLAIRTEGGPLAFAATAQKQIAALDPELPVSRVLTLDQIVGESVTGASFTASLVFAFAILSLALASVGLYGVLSYLSTQRRTEIGIRIALGAQRGRVLRTMLLDGVEPAALGLVLGFAGSAAVVRLLGSMLYRTRPTDPAVYVAVASTLMLVAGLACIVPAWRASRLDPIQVLRTE